VRRRPPTIGTSRRNTHATMPVAKTNAAARKTQCSDTARPLRSASKTITSISLAMGAMSRSAVRSVSAAEGSTSA